MTNILFVCTGNTCRSSVAEKLFHLKNKDHRFQAKSAGILAIDGMPMSDGAKYQFEKRGIEVEHRTRAISDDLINWADLILTMTFSHKNALIKQYPDIVDKIFTLKEYVLDDEKIKEKLAQVNEHIAQIEIKRSTFLLENKRKLAEKSRNMTESERKELEVQLRNQLEPHYKAIDELTAQLPCFDITDPYGGNEKIYEKNYIEIEEMVDKLIKKLQKQ